MRFATLTSLPALTLPITSTARPPEIPYFKVLNTSMNLSPQIFVQNSTLQPRYLSPGPYLPTPPWPIPSPGTVGCYAVDDGAHTMDVGIALITLQGKAAESCRVDNDEYSDISATGHRCKILHTEGSAAMCICGPAGWGFTCGEVARLFERIYVPCRLYVNDSWRLTGQMTTVDGGWLMILPTTRV